MKKLGIWLLSKDLRAAMLALLASLLTLINFPGGFFASILVAFVTLNKGFRSGLFVLVWVALPAVSMMVLKQWSLFDVLLLHCVVVWLLAGILRKTMSWPLVLEIAALLGVFAIVGIHFGVHDVKAWWIQNLTQYIKNLSLDTSWKITPKEMDDLIHFVVPVASGIVAFFVLISLLAELFIARWWQSAMIQPGSLRFEILRLRIHPWVTVVILAFVGAAFFKSPIMIDLIPVVLLPLTVAGLSLMHWFAARNKQFVFVLLFIYLIVLFLPIVMLALLAIVGFWDSCFNVRARFAPQNGVLSK